MPVGVVVGAILLLELLLVAGSWVVSPEVAAGSVVPIDGGISNTRALGQVLYTRYVFLFEGAGLVLLVAMIGAIVLTLKHRPGVKRQDPAVQVARTPETAIDIKKVKSGQGL
jgi:NADH-quinone oxidoreductase subunit J